MKKLKKVIDVGVLLGTRNLKISSGPMVGQTGLKQYNLKGRHWPCHTTILSAYSNEIAVWIDRDLYDYALLTIK